MASKFAKDHGYDAEKLEKVYEATASRAQPGATVDVDRDWLLGLIQQALYFEGRTRKPKVWVHPFAVKGTPIQP